MNKINENLLVLCCHGVYHQGRLFAERPEERDVYLAHIQLASRLLNKGLYDVLVISGGCTKAEIEKSEARGYLDWADDENIRFHAGKVILEEFARTSAENLLFSMCRFYQYFGYFPKRAGSCTLSWKARWHKEVLAPALKITNFDVVTNDANQEKEKILAVQGLVIDQAEVVETNKFDPLEFGKNIKARDVWKKGQPYSSIPLFAQLFQNMEHIRNQINTLTKEQLLHEQQVLVFPWV